MTFYKITSFANKSKLKYYNVFFADAKIIDRREFGSLKQIKKKKKNYYLPNLGA